MASRSAVVVIVVVFMIGGIVPPEQACAGGSGDPGEGRGADEGGRFAAGRQQADAGGPRAERNQQHAGSMAWDQSGKLTIQTCHAAAGARHQRAERAEGYGEEGSHQAVAEAPPGGGFGARRSVVK